MKKLVLALAAILGLCTTSMHAQEPPESTDFSRWQIRVRGVGAVVNSSADVATIGGDVRVTNHFIPELDITYFFTENLAAELILGTTKHSVNTVGSDLTALGIADPTNVDLGSVRLLPPTLTAQYHFRPEATAIAKPYVGAGVTYALFYDAKAGNTVADVSYDNAFGLATQAGIDFMLTDTFFFNVDVKYIFLKTDVSVNATNLAEGLHIPASVKLNPFLFGFGVGMKL